MMRSTIRLVCLTGLLPLAACGTRSSASVEPVTGANSRVVLDTLPTSPDRVVVTSEDITDRPYRSLGDISVDVSKWTLFDADPTRAQIDKALRDKAASLGADAVVLVRYGAVGIGAFSWGKLEGKGRAVQYAVVSQ